MPWNAMRIILLAEAAAAFDDLTRSGRDAKLTAQAPFDWPNTFRYSHLIPAVEYVNANRARTLGMRAVADLFEDLDVLVCPTNSTQLIMTNMTGNPAIILPHGFRPADTPEPQRPTDQGGAGTPLSITFLGDLFGEAKICAFAKAFQDVTDFHLKHPNMDAMKS
jgi:Asp-tRNA(Asn)/Glu-tRNA(Gln) amidotransferase A subunit family amidase